MKTNVSKHECRRGKVRDIYDIGNDELVIVATDRISAFDVVMKNGIPYKGQILTALTQFWLEILKRSNPNHLVGMGRSFLPEAFRGPEFKNRTMLCRKVDEVLPVECIVRGHITGSGWKDYKKTGEICGIKLPSGLQESSRFPKPIFTPSTKAEEGHDENISFLRVYELVGKETAELIREWSIALYKTAYRYAEKRGIIIADTKFEFGRVDNYIMLIDEVLTPDSSRFWPVEGFSPGRSQPNFDKQFVRDYLNEQCDIGNWDKEPPGLKLPNHIVRETQEKYMQIYKMLTGKNFEV